MVRFSFKRSRTNPALARLESADWENEITETERLVFLSGKPVFKDASVLAQNMREQRQPLGFERDDRPWIVDFDSSRHQNVADRREDVFAS